MKNLSFPNEPQNQLELDIVIFKVTKDQNNQEFYLKKYTEGYLTDRNKPKYINLPTQHEKKETAPPLQTPSVYQANRMAKATGGNMCGRLEQEEDE